MRRSDGGLRALIALVVILLVVAVVLAAVYGLAMWVAHGMGGD
jgi:type IV secretory pathway TrbD component